MNRRFQLYILILILGQFFYSCEKEQERIENALIYVELYPQGVNLAAKVTIAGINPEIIGECGIYWQSSVKKITEINLNEAKIVKQTGSQTTYIFEFFPWVFLTDELFTFTSTAYVVVQAYISKAGSSRNQTYSRMVADNFTTYLSAGMIGDGRIENNDYINTISFLSKTEEDIEEYGMYWGKNSKNGLNGFNKIACGNTSGSYQIAIPNGAYMDELYYLGYIKTRLGTYYTSKTPVTMPGEKMTVSISSDLKDITYERATLFASVESDNPIGYPILERGFCYFNILKVKEKTFPTIDDEVFTVRPGIGSFSGTITGLDAFAIYHVRAYAKNKKGIAYSPSYTILPTPSQQYYVPSMLISSYMLDPVITGQIRLSGSSSNDRGYFITERGFCYNQTGNMPTIEDTKIIAEGTGLGSFKATVSNLAPGKYFVLSYGINAAGVGYSVLYNEVTIP